MHVIVRLCIEKMDTPICSKQARRCFLPRRERRGLRAAIMVNFTGEKARAFQPARYKETSPPAW